MNQTELPHSCLKLTTAIALALVTYSSYLPRLQAQPAPSPVAVIRFIPPPPPPSADRGAPSGRRQGGASRGQCPAGELPLTALVPATQKSLDSKSGNSGLNTVEFVWGLTTAAHPTLWFYLPYAIAPELPIEFVLQDEQDNDIYHTTLTTSTPPGIFHLQLPTTATPLAVGKMYHWYLIVNCDPDAPPMVEGWVQREAVNPALASQLQQATPRQQAALYAQHGIWYDALTALAELRRTEPQAITPKNDWASLLQSVGLEAIANEPIQPCCTNAN